MWSLLVVIILPFFERFFCFSLRGKQSFVQAFVSQLAVEAFDKSILLGFARGDVVPIDPVILNPFQDRHASEFGAIIHCPAGYCAAMHERGKQLWLACRDP